MAAPASNCDEKSRLDSDQRQSLTCDCQLLVGRNNHDGNRGIIGRNGRCGRETLVVHLVIDAHTEGEQTLANLAAQISIVFTNASGEGNDIQTTELSGVGADVLDDTGDVDVQGQACTACNLGILRACHSHRSNPSNPTAC